MDLDQFGDFGFDHGADGVQVFFGVGFEAEDEDGLGVGGCGRGPSRGRIGSGRRRW